MCTRLYIQHQRKQSRLRCQLLTPDDPGFLSRQLGIRPRNVHLEVAIMLGFGDKFLEAGDEIDRGVPYLGIRV